MTICSSAAGLSSAQQDIRITPQSTASAQPQTAAGLEDYSYGDLRPLLSADFNSQSLALVRIANLAASTKSLTVDQAADAVTQAVALINLASPRRSESNVVRLEAVVALRAIALNRELLAAISPDIRESAFSVLACLPCDRSVIRESVGNLSAEFSFAPRETDAGVRALCESVAGLYSPAWIVGVTPKIERETDPFLPWPEPESAKS